MRPHIRDVAIEPHFYSHLFECRLRLRGELLVEHAEDAGLPFDEHDAGRTRIDGAEVVAHGESGEFADGAGHFDAGRAAADDHEGEQPGGGFRVGFALGPFERREYAAANLGGVFEALEPRGECGPFVVPEVGVRRARGEHESIERDAGTIFQHERFSGHVEALDFA